MHVRRSCPSAISSLPVPLRPARGSSEWCIISYAYSAALISPVSIFHPFFLQTHLPHHQVPSQRNSSRTVHVGLCSHSSSNINNKHPCSNSINNPHLRHRQRLLWSYSDNMKRFPFSIIESTQLWWIVRVDISILWPIIQSIALFGTKRLCRKSVKPTMDVSHQPAPSLYSPMDLAQKLGNSNKACSWVAI